VTKNESELISQAAAILRASQHTAALTGAGISTPSGIPDFRSRGSGLWERFDPMQVASLSSFRYHPEHFFEWFRPLAIKMLNAEPNPAHVALAKLEKAGILTGVVTQNIDNLHRRAGSLIVYEIHGHMREATCISCFRRDNTPDLLKHFMEEGTLPLCPECGGILKPNVVLFGEQLPHRVVEDARSLLAKSDLILVAGSSLEVTPAALFPIPAINAGAKLIIINHEPTYLDERATLIFRQDVAQILPQITAEVLGDPNESPS